MEKAIVLSLIDQEWKEHLREMDDLKQSVQNAVFEQKDPLLIYKFESVELFKRFLSKVNFDMISFLMKADIPQEEAVPATAVQQTVRRQLRRLLHCIPIVKRNLKHRNGRTRRIWHARWNPPQKLSLSGRSRSPTGIRKYRFSTATVGF